MQNSFKHPWKQIITMGRAHDLLRQDVMRHLKYLQKEIGYRYCRFHALFHDDMAVVERMKSGEIHFHWHHIDKVFDALLEIGLKPFVELNPMPSALASGETTIFFYEMNVTPPRSYHEWEMLIAAFAQHCIDRYGSNEVRSWYFEVWNEPNLSNFWTGTRNDYFKLYSHAANGIKKTDKELRIGGPATAGGAWVAEIIDFCHQHQVPLDFISTHSYPQDEQNLYEDGASPYYPGEYFTEIVREVQDTVRRSPLPELEIHWTEWNTQSARAKKAISWSSNIYVDNVFAASFIVKHMLALDQACDSLGWWIASDIFEEYGYSQNPFSCNYGLLTNHGIPKASCNAFKLLARLTGEQVELPIVDKLAHARGYAMTRDGSITKLIIWHHPPLTENKGETWAGSLNVPHIADKSKHLISSAHIKPQKGSPWETWCGIEHPNHLTPYEEEALRYASEPERSLHCEVATETGLTLSWELAPYEVLYLEIRRLPPAATGKGSDQGKWTDLDQKLNEKTR